MVKAPPPTSLLGGRRFCQSQVHFLICMEFMTCAFQSSWSNRRGLSRG